mgnify:CR=1 FL=1
MAEGALTEAALAPVVRLLSNLRLTLILILVMWDVMISHTDARWVIVVSLLALPANCLLLFRWGRRGVTLVIGSYFTTWDAVSSVSVLIVDFVSVRSAPAFSISYLLLSALLIGVISGDKALFAWCVPVATGVASLIYVFSNISDRLLVLVLLGTAVLVVLGRRMSRQTARIEGLAADAAEAHSLQVGAEERLILARDLHDTVAKSAAGLRMLAEVLRDSLEETDYGAEATALFAAADALSSESRAVLDELRSLPTDDLRARLAQDAETWGRRTGVPVDVECFGNRISGDASITWQAQRVLGELLSNIEKHSKASKVLVRVSGESTLCIRVDDNGIGLPQRILDDSSNLRGSGHYGLCGVAERLDALGGRLRLSSRPGGGTTVRVDIPYSQRTSNTTASGGLPAPGRTAA